MLGEHPVFPGLTIEIILDFLKLFGNSPVLRIRLKKLSNHCLALDLKFLMNSIKIPSIPAAFPIFMILIAALSFSKEKGFESGESTGSKLIVDFKFVSWISERLFIMEPYYILHYCYMLAIEGLEH